MFLPPQLDMQTVAWSCGLVALVFAAAMTAFSQRFPQFPGLEWLALGDAALAAGVWLVAVAGPTSPWLGVLLAQALIVGALMLNYEGSRRFVGLPAWRRLSPHVALAVLVPVSWWFTFRTPDASIQGALFLACAAYVSTLTALALYLGPVRAIPSRMRLTAGVFAGLAMLLWLGAAHRVGSPEAGGVLGVLAMLGLLVFVVLKNFSFLQAATRALIEEMSRQSRTDPLTGLLNRRTLMDQGAIELSRARRQAVPLSVIMVDIDHFKAINDGYGHKVGDSALMRMGRLLLAQTRAFDVRGRFGGEEFVILLPGTPLFTAVAVAEKLRAALAAEAWPELDGRRTTASFGVAGFADHDSLQELISSAERALRTAKSNGRNCVESVAI